MYFKALAILATIGSALAQRPSGTSICDYYTAALFKAEGGATPANEYTLLTVLVNTVVIGNYTPCTVGGGLPGILAPAEYGGEQVNLLPYFNGCLLSTNRNNVPVSVNFLDGGGAAPLKANMPADSTSSNQYFLLTHLYQFFGALLGCSGYGETGFPAYGGDPNMGQVHQFMALDANEVGYFISQVGGAATCFGVASSDVAIVAGVLESYFGYRCLPPVTVVDGPQPDSICEACSCPLAANPQCDLYFNGGCLPPPKVAPQCAAPSSSAKSSSSSSCTSSKEATTTWESTSSSTSCTEKTTATSTWSG